MCKTREKNPVFFLGGGGGWAHEIYIVEISQPDIFSIKNELGPNPNGSLSQLRNELFRYLDIQFFKSPGRKFLRKHGRFL